MPGKPAESTDANTYNTLTIVGSKSKYSAKPAQTPAILRLFDL